MVYTTPASSSPKTFGAADFVRSSCLLRRLPQCYATCYMLKCFIIHEQVMLHAKHDQTMATTL